VLRRPELFWAALREPAEDVQGGNLRFGRQPTLDIGDVRIDYVSALKQGPESGFPIAGLTSASDHVIEL
jgi:hypothetical protein